MIQKRIGELKNVSGSIILKFENEHIEYVTTNNNYQVKWKAIKYIIIYKYSICFIPTEINIPIISVSRDYEKDVLEAINEVKKKELIIR